MGRRGTEARPVLPAPPHRVSPVANKVVVDREFASLIPPLKPDEREQLEQNLVRDGCRDPLVVWRTGGQDILLEGHSRYEICQRKKIGFRIKAIKLASREHAKIWIEENQLGRRNLTDDQRAAIVVSARQRASVLLRSAQARRARASVRTRHPVSEAARAHVLVTSVHTSARRNTRREYAQQAKVSERKLRYATTLQECAPDLYARVRQGAVTLSNAMHHLQQAENRKRLESVEAMKAKEVAGIFDVIVVDPPWPKPGAGVDGLPVNYPLMTDDAIEREVGRQLARHAAPACHVFLWATQTSLRTAFRLLDAWKLEYVCELVWHKNGGPQPTGLPQYNHEMILYARHRQPRFVDTKSFFTCFNALRGKHSEKPEEFYALLRRVTGGRRLGMFNRRRIEGFVGWGKEAPEAP